MKNTMKRILSMTLVLVMLGSFATVAMAQSIFQLTVVDVEGFGGGDVEVGTDLSLVLPASPTKNGYRFTGWVVTNAAGTVIDQPETMPAYDLTFTAQWEALDDRYTITFLTPDGEIISSCDYLEGESIELPDYPGEGYRLVAWRNARTGKIEKIPSVMPAKNLEFLAVIEEVYYTITFYDGTAEVGEVTVGGGETAQIIDRIPQSGKIFAGWSLTPGGEVAYHAGDEIILNENMDLYAVWTTVTQPTVTLKYPTLVFEDVILMNVYFAAENLDSVMEMGLVTYTESVASADVNTANAIIPGYSWSEADGLYYATTNGIAAKDLGDEIYFAVYAKLADGSYYYTRVVSYSPSKYAYASLTTGSAAMKPIVVAMLNYGSAAQTYFNYKTDSLVNANLTADQKALVEDYRADMITAVSSPSAAKQGTLANNGGFSRRYPTVSFEGAFCINYYCVPSAAVQGQITLYYWDQAAFDSNEVLTTDNAKAAIPMVPEETTGAYNATVEGIAAKDLDQGVYVAFVYSDGTTTYSSGVLAYSIGTYCATQATGTGTVADLAKATAVYGYYAKELFY